MIVAAFIVSVAGIVAYLVSCYRLDRKLAQREREADIVIIDLRKEFVVKEAERITREAAGK